MSAIKSLFLLCFVTGIIFIIPIDAARRSERNGQRKLRQQQQRPQSTSTISSTMNIDHGDDHHWNDGHHQFAALSHQQHHMESFAEDDEYFDDIKPAGHSCEDIRIEICHDVGYNVTSMPNFVGHELQSDAELQLQSFIPLISYGCSSQLKFFLCSVYVPMCTEKVPVMIGPCRPLCESVRSRCAPVLSGLGFQWPTALNCSKFVPENTIDHMCMEGPPPHESELIVGANKTPIIKNVLGGHNSIASQPPLNVYHSTNNNNRQSHPSVHLMIPGSSRHHHHHLIPQTSQISPSVPPQHNFGDLLYGPSSIDTSNRNRNKPLQPKQMTPEVIMTNVIDAQAQDERSSSIASTGGSNQCWQYRRSENYVFLEHPRGRCVARCESDVLFTEENKNFVDYWTMVWACLSLASCLFTLIAFMTGSTDRFHYPERAIFYIALCSMIYASAYIYRTLVGRIAASCYQEGPDKQQLLLVQEGAHNPHCTFSFLMLYYFGMTGSAWWLVLAITWSLSVAFNWSQQRLSYHSQLYHSLAWTLPALQTLAALVMRAVDADELTGICYVGSQDDSNLLRFVIIPMAIYLTTGLLFIIISFISVRFNAITNNNDSDANHPCCNCCIGAAGSDEENSSNSDSSNVDAETDHQSSLSQSDAASVGCGDFCRRLRRNYGRYGQNSGHHHGLGRVGTTAQAGSGHSLLLLPASNRHHNHHRRQMSNNFCSATVSSSTSSYSSSTMSTSHHHHNNNNNPISKDKHCINANGNGLWSNVAVSQTNPNRAIIGRSNNNHNLTAYPSHQQRAVAATMAINDAFDYDSHEDAAGRRHEDDAALIRSGIFALFYTLPALCVLSTYIYEYLYRQQWLLRQTDTTTAIMTSTATNMINNSPTMIESLEYNRPNFEIFNMRLFMSFVIGIKTGIWILTARSPITALRCVITRCMTKKVFPVNNTINGHHPTHHVHHHHNQISRTLQQQQQIQKPNPAQILPPHSQILYNNDGQTMINQHHLNQLNIDSNKTSLEHTNTNIGHHNQQANHFFFMNDMHLAAAAAAAATKIPSIINNNETTFFPDITNNNNNNGSTTMSTTISSLTHHSNPHPHHHHTDHIQRQQQKQQLADIHQNRANNSGGGNGNETAV
ncbi:uncharacterized protein LOC113789642 [Dermatophagoides pteronyssinus]|uniref:uncharacterized protein LOC113789642 n=1 Tax=Dermatophagoides pteronyssinus TaxID=6956 RepID=UPI003F67A020